VLTRRDVITSAVKAGAGTAMLAVIPRPLLGPFGLGRAPAPLPSIRDPRVKEIALAAIDAATTAGARYADVRLTHTWERMNFLWGKEEMSIGVRALVNGYWGFACGPVWSVDAAARLGRDATGEASTNAIGKQRPVELAPVTVVRDQHWETPLVIDPFTVPANEVQDYLNSLTAFTNFTAPGFETFITWDFKRQEKAFASSEGTYVTQRLDQASVGFAMERNGFGAEYDFPMGPSAAAGWEYIRSAEAAIRASVPRLVEEIDAESRIPVKPMDPGRYDVVCDAQTVAQLLTPTVGVACELDRALGYEANAGGTSYLNQPLEMLGTYKVGSPIMTVTANRSQPGALATVRWDDDGATPNEGTLVKDGVLNDFLTTRESATWIKPYYTKHQQPVHSHGCSAASDALNAPLTHVPNLVLTPGTGDDDFESLVSGLTKGFAVRRGGANLDYQQRTGMGSGAIYEVRNGKRVAHVRGLGFAFRAPEPWKNLTALGGTKSAQWSYGISQKGEPSQTTFHSVSAVPVVMQQLTFIDPRRRL
jgi:TldD protein